MGHIGSVCVRSNWFDAVPVLRPIATRVVELGRGLERTSEPKGTSGMGTDTLDDNHPNQSAHKEVNQGKGFDCVSLGKRTEEESKGLDTGRNFRCNKPT